MKEETFIRMESSAATDVQQTGLLLHTSTMLAVWE